MPEITRVPFNRSALPAPRCALGVALGLGLLAGAAFAQPTAVTPRSPACGGEPTLEIFLVDDLEDGSDRVPGDGLCQNEQFRCNLRAAIQEANALGSPGSPPSCLILVGGVHRLSRPGRNEDDALFGDLDVHRALRIQGIGPFPAFTLIEAQGLDRVLQVHATPNFRPRLSIANLRLSGGHTALPDTAGGGAILSAGELVLEDVELVGHRADQGHGGAVAMLASTPVTTQLTLSRVLLASNEARAGHGGALWLQGWANAPLALLAEEVVAQDNRALDGGAMAGTGEVAMAIRGSAFFGNAASQGAGGIAVGSGARLQLDASTLHANAGSGGALALRNAGTVRVSHLTLTENVGPGLHARATPVELSASILHGNSAADLDVDGLLNSLRSGFNVLGDGSIDGISLAELKPATWWVGADPALGAMGSVGGFAPGRKPLSGSPVIDGYRQLPAGQPACSGVDQRGLTRPQVLTPGIAPGEGCDIGAIELGERLYASGFESAP